MLDVGCGKGQAITTYNRSGRFSTVGVDIFLPFLQECVAVETHDDVVLCDVRYLPFGPKTFDVVLCLEVLEHLQKRQGLQLLVSLAAIAREKVVVSLPLGSHPLHLCDELPYPDREHISQWKPAELRDLGYAVKINVLRNTTGEGRIAARMPTVLRAMWKMVSVASGPFVNLFPEMGGHMVGFKVVRDR